MTDYRRRNLADAQTSTPLDPLRGGLLMRRSRASSVHATGDRVLSHGRRVLLQVGLHGADDWHVSDDAVGGALDHPHPDTERVVARLPAVTLTPGHFPRLYVVANPSGMTATAGPLTAQGAKGIVRLACSFDNGIDSPTITKSVAIPGSTEANAARPTGPGAAWSHLHRRRSTLFEPANLALPANLAAWSEGFTVSMVLSYVGSPRAVDVIVVEEPIAYARDISAGDWSTPLHSNAQGDNAGQLAGPWPVVKRSASDAGGGVEVLTDAARRLSQEIGPVLWSATTWEESAGDFSSTEAGARSVTSTAWTELIDDVATAYTDDDAGWSLSAGANARRVQESEATAVLRDRTNAVPVRCYIYGRMTTAGPTARVRFETGPESVAEVSVTAGTSWGWHSAPGTLRCGLGAQDPTVAQVRGKVSGAGATFEWRYVLVLFDGR
jgi:hypothetical protein